MEEIRHDWSHGNTSDISRCQAGSDIEQQLDYPGEIKVTVIRETRSVDTAK